MRYGFWPAAAVAAVALTAGCALDRDNERSGERNGAPPVETGAAVPRSAPPQEWAALRARVQPLLDAIDHRLRAVHGLTSAERTALRRNVNERHIEQARQLGVNVTGPVERLIAARQLVRLADTTALWIVRELDYSIPYVTPDARAMLVEIGRRFHARLDSLGVPRFRLDITSALRTADQQMALRRRNSNASRVESSHEFGTMVDIAYRRYAPPAHSPFGNVTAYPTWMTDSLLIETTRERGAELQAALGRVLQEMQLEGKLLVRMERRQTVYHITVAQRYPAQRADPG